MLPDDLQHLLNDPKVVVISDNASTHHCGGKRRLARRATVPSLSSGTRPEILRGDKTCVPFNRWESSPMKSTYSPMRKDTPPVLRRRAQDHIPPLTLNQSIAGLPSSSDYPPSNCMSFSERKAYSMAILDQIFHAVDRTLGDIEA